MEIATSLAREKGINVNSNLKRQGVYSDQTVIVKEILMDMPKKMIITALAEFGKIKSIKIQLIGLWQKVVFRALLFTLSVEMIAHDLSTLLKGVGEKTCIINCLLDSGNKIHCAVVGFESEDAMESAYCTELIFSSVKLSWTRLDLVCCEKCDLLGHSALECNALFLPITKSSKIVKKLGKLYAKKSVSISRPAAFDGKSWTQVVSLASSFGDLYFNSGIRFDSSPLGSLGIKRNMLVVQIESSINDCLALLELSDIMCRLNGVKLVPLVSITQVVLSATFVPTLASPDTDMVLDVPWLSFSPSSSVLEDKMADLSPSSSKILIFKVGGLESKIVTLEVFIGSILEKVAMCNFRGITNLAKQKDIVHWHKNLGNMISIITETKLRSGIRLWVFTSGLDVGFHGAGVAIIMNNFLAWYVSKVDEVSGHLISVHFLFKNKLLVMILGLYAGVSISTQFSQAADINSMVSKVVNSSFFVVLGGDFNENRSSKSVSFKFCLGLGLVNAFDGHSLVKDSTWNNSRGVEKVIDFILVSENLASAMALHFVNIWLAVNAVEAFKVNSMILNGVNSMELIKHLLVIKKRYCKSKYYESKTTGDTAIRKAIDHYMENFCPDKRKMIKSILECPFCKVVLDYLVVDNELVIEPNKMKLKVDKIMEGAFSGVMVDIGMEELSLVVDNLLNGKAAGLSGIPNELWKHCGGEVLVCLLKLLNLCLSIDAVLNLPIALVKTTYKILSKILSNQISLACNKFNVLHNNNFSVLKGTLTQSPIFAIGLVIEDALEKNRELWLMLQNMYKAYDLVNWHYLRASLYCIKIYRCFIQFFGNIHEDRLNRVMTNFGLSDGYKVKRHEQLCRYRIDSKFVAKSGRIEVNKGKTSFLAAGAFASMQYILNIANEFFVINDISINNDKTVAIFINQEVKNALLLINRVPILIAKKRESHQYLGIFLSTEGFSKPSLAQAHKNPIVGYHTQFSFILHHSFLYSLKLFEQVQSKGKLALLISFSNGHGILGHLFNHRFLNLLYVSPVNNFLAGVVKIFLENDLSLANNLPYVFHGPGNFPMSGILNPRGLVSYWFFLMADFMNNYISLGVGATIATKEDVLNVLDSDRFSEIYTNGSLRCAGSVGTAGKMTAYFLAADVDIGIKIAGLLSSALAELQAVVLALKLQIVNLLRNKNISIKWVKVKEHSNVLGNIRADALANETTFLSLSLPVNIRKRFLVTEKTAISDNVHHFAWDLYLLICCACWKAGLGFDIVPNIMIKEIDWNTTATIWHPDSHMFSGFTSRKSANLRMYLMKTVYRWLSVAVKKRLYSRSYFGVLCLLYDKVKFSDHVFACFGDFGLHENILVEAADK
ncbi:hypothetical protein G9A89_015045 [Geosiphon pyriformis]|nr:hypothetical protein G9A89_015045 [Geosiphon pyriformis]